MWTLIVAEDDARLADTIAEAARRAPGLATARTATTAPEALALIDAVPAEAGHRLVVLSDYNLKDPKLNGLDVLQHAQRRHPRAVRVLMSGEERGVIFSSPEREAVPHRFVEKPFLLPRLLDGLPFAP